MRAEAEPSFIQRRCTEAAEKEQAKLIALGVIRSGEGDGVWDATNHVDEAYSRYGRAKKTRLVSELSRWNKIALEDVDSPLQHWLNLAKSPNNMFPVQTRLNLDAFSIPAMSAECERTFSQTKRLISDDRNDLSAARLSCAKELVI